MRDRRLGLGLDALLGGAAVEPVPVAALFNGTPSTAVGAGTPPPSAPGLTDHPTELAIADLKPNPQQPRTVFDEEDLRSLADSIRQSGVLQPVVVRRRHGAWQIVAGERRMRAAKIAGLNRVPVVVRDVDDEAMLQLALVENIQRRDLNAIEKARAFRQLMELNRWTQEQAAGALGLGRPTVANFLRLLELPTDIQDAVAAGAITMGHARALLGTTNVAARLLLLKKIIADDLSVRAVEKLIASKPEAVRKTKSTPAKDAYLADLEQRIGQFFGTKAEIVTAVKGGALIIHWYSNAHFTEVLRKIGL